MPFTILYPEALYPDDSVEREVYGPEVLVVMRATTKLADLNTSDLNAAKKQVAGTARSMGIKVAG